MLSNLSVQALIDTGRVTRQPVHSNYTDLGDHETPGEDYQLLVDGEAIGGTYWCGADYIADGERWASYGPAGSSWKHRTREDAEAAQLTRWIAQRLDPCPTCRGRGSFGDIDSSEWAPCWDCRATGVELAAADKYPDVRAVLADNERLCFPGGRPEPATYSMQIDASDLAVGDLVLSGNQVQPVCDVQEQPAGGLVVDLEHEVLPVGHHELIVLVVRMPATVMLNEALAPHLADARARRAGS